MQRFFASLSEELAQKKIKLSDELPILELLARHYPPAWLMIADLWRESTDAGTAEQTIEALTRYIETSEPGMHQKVAWERIAINHRQRSNQDSNLNPKVLTLAASS
jgi:hypothetical protein